MLVRLQNAMGRDNLLEQVLFQTPQAHCFEQAKSLESVNIVVGYNGSPKSHTALDVALLMAHQTQLATKEQVTVQVVYVLEDSFRNDYQDILSIDAASSSRLTFQVPLYFPQPSASKEVGTRISSQVKLQATVPYPKKTSAQEFAQAETILRQAICLAEEWKSSFKAHLRFGCVATELKIVAELEAASLLILGCDSSHHPLIQQLGSNFPFPVLGIPPCFEDALL
ncbi:universal stress protein [Iningainema sp. BLCCT55]|uniref:Universal stress protein n=2 Tax=Iningainema TaxID=1932705 RepID=A0A8J7BZ68_9CYAN|nr:universal stress protein [Iningainema tapete]MBD2776972.1 universal stress protein [Iningainema tapete BLCC-T55]